MNHPHSESRQTRIAMAEEDLKVIEALPLSTISPAEMVIALTRATSSLADMIRMHRERDADERD